MPFWLVLSFSLGVTVSDTIYFPVVWGTYTAIAIDDYLNSDDDFHKKIRKAANKIKWAMSKPRLISRPQ